MSLEQNNQTIHPNSEKLYRIADSIAEARLNHVNNYNYNQAGSNDKFIGAISKLLFNQRWNPKKISIQDLKQREAEIGSTIFGVRQPNETIAFFNDTRNSWFFHQKIEHSKRNSSSQTFHYDVTEKGVLRVVNGQKMICEYSKGQDLDNFMKATAIYHDRVMSEVYGIDTSSSKINQ
jgi:Tol biopolymer transport system component